MNPSDGVLRLCKQEVVGSSPISSTTQTTEAGDAVGLIMVIRRFIRAMKRSSGRDLEPHELLTPEQQFEHEHRRGSRCV